MMSAWTVSDPLRHPWYSPPSLKRKHSDCSDEDTARNSDSDQEAAPSVYPTPPPEGAGYAGDDNEYIERKRRRCDTIERRMARMYIDGRNVNQPDTRYSQNRAWMAPSISASQSTASNVSYSSYESYSYTAGSTSPVAQSDLLPQYAIEEPISPDFKKDEQLGPSSSVDRLEEPTITEVRMKGAGPAWYEREKDRIVITDLDEAVEEAEKEEYRSEAELHPDSVDRAESNVDYSISAVLLDHIKRQANFPYVSQSGGTEEIGGALVLFRPPPLPFFSSPPSGESTLERDEKHEVQVEEMDEGEACAFTPSGNFTLGTLSMDQETEEMEVGEPMDMDMDIEM